MGLSEKGCILPTHCNIGKMMINPMFCMGSSHVFPMFFHVFPQMFRYHTYHKAWAFVSAVPVPADPSTTRSAADGSVQRGCGRPQSLGQCDEIGWSQRYPRISKDCSVSYCLWFMNIYNYCSFLLITTANYVYCSLLLLVLRYMWTPWELVSSWLTYWESTSLMMFNCNDGCWKGEEFYYLSIYTIYIIFVYLDYLIHYDTT